MTFGTKNKPDIYLESSPLNVVDSYKYLGITPEGPLPRDDENI